MTGDFAKIRCYKKQICIQDISERFVLSRTKKGQVDPGSTLTNQCGSNGPVSHVSNFSVTSKRLYTAAMYPVP